jgi:hypothetical protein
MVLIICGACFDVYLSGSSALLPKYLELQFQITAAIASILTGETIHSSVSSATIH